MAVGRLESAGMPEPTNPLASPRKVVVILNPAAGRRQGERRRTDLEQLLKSEARTTGSELQIVETTAHGSGVALGARAAADGADVVAIPAWLVDVGLG